MSIDDDLCVIVLYSLLYTRPSVLKIGAACSKMLLYTQKTHGATTQTTITINYRSVINSVLKC